ncbi:TPA: DNA-directed RNA polymerase subunit F [Candidatus Micrarchaeota archaeon]|nr:DNA-directed RNA polymerase subunit F [Candidatus Micrarchaeota archaeon]
MLKNRQKGDAALSYEQQNTLDYAEKFAHLTAKDAAKLKKALEALGFLDAKQIAKVVDLLPAKDDDVRAALFQNGFSLEAEQIKQVIAACKEYR